MKVELEAFLAKPGLNGVAMEFQDCSQMVEPLTLDASADSSLEATAGGTYRYLWVCRRKGLVRPAMIACICSIIYR